MDRKELVFTITKDILVAAIAKDSQVNLDLGVRAGDSQITALGERFKALSKHVESALDGLKSD